MGSRMGTCFYQAEPITAREVASILSSLPRNFTVEGAVAYRPYYPVHFKSAVKETPLAVELLGKFGGLIFIDGNDFGATISLREQNHPASSMEGDMLLVESGSTFDIGFATRWNDKDEPSAQQILKNNNRYVSLISAILKCIGDVVLFAVGDNYYYLHEYGNYNFPGCYPQCVTHGHWITFYGAPLLDSEISRLLLKAPVYKAEKVGGGVLLVDAPAAWAYLPLSEHDLSNQPKEIQALSKYKDQSTLSSAYFEQHGLYEKLQKKAEEFGKSQNVEIE